MSKLEVYTICCIPALLCFFIVLQSATRPASFSGADITCIIVSGMILTGIYIKMFQKLMHPIEKAPKQVPKISVVSQKEIHNKSTINTTTPFKFPSPSCEEYAPVLTDIKTPLTQPLTPKEQALIAEALLPSFAENTASEMEDYYKAFLLALFKKFPPSDTLLTDLEEIFTKDSFFQGKYICLYFENGESYKRQNDAYNTPFKRGAGYYSLISYISTFRNLKDFKINP